MATTADTFQAHTEEHHHDADHKPGFFARWFMSTNHKDIGTLYMIFSIFAGIIGGAISGLMRWELAEPGIQILGQTAAWLNGGAVDFDQQLHTWNVLITAHGLIMVFFVVMPATMGGFANWFVPLMIGAPDMAFPRMNNIAFWLTAVAFGSLMASTFFPGGTGNGARMLKIVVMKLIELMIEAAPAMCSEKITKSTDGPGEPEVESGA